MGWRFRKSFKIFPGFRVNLGKKGITSLSVGGKGVSTNLSSKGVRSTLSLPGTGLSYSADSSPNQEGSNQTLITQTPLPWKCPECSFINVHGGQQCSYCPFINTKIRPWQPDYAYHPPRNNKNGIFAAVALGVAFCICILCAKCPTSPPASNSTPQIRPLLTTPKAVASATPAVGKSTSNASNRRKMRKGTSADIYSRPDGSSSTATPRGTRQSGLIRGPRGGCYYINSRGNKTYVDRSLCN